MTFLNVVGPVPPQGRMFCTYCLMEYKSVVIAACMEEISRLQDDGLDRIIEWDLRKHQEGTGAKPPMLAVGIGFVNNNASWGMTHLCWTHVAVVPGLAGIETKASGIAVARGNVDDAVARMQQGPAGQLAPGLKGQIR